MPELPEVETTMNGLKPHIEGALIQNVVVRCAQLRSPIPPLQHYLNQQHVGTLFRRAKYLLMPVNTGTVIIHLGMSGSLRLVNKTMPLQRHDHIDIVFSDEKIMRYSDARRFGAWLWTEHDPLTHALLKSLGPEPLSADFTVDFLMQRAKGRRVAIKPFIMDSKVVVGIGNIYAAEALFLAGIHPLTPAGKVTRGQFQALVDSIQHVLTSAIKQGGTTVKDFVNSEGKPGYFTQQLAVYGRKGLPCINCQLPLQSFKLGQRSTVYCGHCQVLF